MFFINELIKKKKKQRPSLLYTDDIVPTIFKQMFEKMDKPAKLLFFDKSSSEEKPRTNIKNKVQFAYVMMMMMMMMMSTYPKGAVLLSLQYMATNNVRVDLTAKLVVLLPVVVQVSILGHHDLDIDHSQGHSPIRYGMAAIIAATAIPVNGTITVSN